MEQAADLPLLTGLFGPQPPSPAAFTLGRGGRPVYFPGPEDSGTRIRAVRRALDRKLGEDGWDFAPIRADPEMRALVELIDRMPRGPEHDDGGGRTVEHGGSTDPGA